MQSMNLRPAQRQFFRKRVTVLFTVCMFMLLLLLLRTAYLQIVLGDEYSTRAERNRVRLMPILPNRGEVYARNFKRKLITNKKSFCITVVPASLPNSKPDRRQVVLSLAKLLDMDPGLVQERINQDKWDPYTPKVIREDVGYPVITRLAEHINALPGVFWENRPIRIYTMTNTLSHLLGYTGYISREELKKMADRGYRSGSLIGKTGIERVYDMDLRGVEGVYEREVDAFNRVTSQRVRKAPVHGNPMVLTVDADMQQTAQQAMKKYRGAVVVTRPSTGEVLALLSNPGYDASLFYNRINQSDFQRIQLDPAKPLFNRAIQAMYPPGSIFKLVTMAAGVDNGVINEYTSHYCSGKHRLGDRIFRCWYGRHGRLALLNAVKNSCNVFFYKASLDIKASRIFAYARKFGFGRISRIDLLGESPGFIPTKAWKQKSAGRPWLDGDTLNLAIGQGDLLATPMQVNMLTCAIFNEGFAYRPYIKKQIRSLKTGKVIEENPGKVILFRNDIKKSTYRLIKRGMARVVNGGTGSAAWSPNLDVIGKTSSSENQHKLTHAWFTCIAKPKNLTGEEAYRQAIAVTVICENSGGGGAIAAPIAAMIIRRHFENMTPDQTMQAIWKRWAKEEKKKKDNKPQQ